MSEFYRKAAHQKSKPMLVLAARMTCDECGNARATGNHIACSKKRQRKYVKEKPNE